MWKVEKPDGAASLETSRPRSRKAECWVGGSSMTSRRWPELPGEEVSRETPRKWVEVGSSGEGRKAKEVRGCWKLRAEG